MLLLASLCLVVHHVQNVPLLLRSATQVDDHVATAKSFAILHVQIEYPNSNMKKRGNEEEAGMKQKEKEEKTS